MGVVLVGDYVAAAEAAGAIPAEVSASAGLPSFHEIALHFHPQADDDSLLAEQKVRYVSAGTTSSPAHLVPPVVALIKNLCMASLAELIIQRMRSMPYDCTIEQIALAAEQVTSSSMCVGCRAGALAAAPAAAFAALCAQCRHHLACPVAPRGAAGSQVCTTAQCARRGGTANAKGRRSRGCETTAWSALR